MPTRLIIRQSKEYAQMMFIRDIILPGILLLALNSCQNTPSDQTDSVANTDGLPVMGQRNQAAIPDFKLVNQYRDTITQQDLEGKVYVADFFFTTCPTICPKMTQQMLRVHEAYKQNPDVVLLSHSIDPQHDTVEVLRRYAERHGIKEGTGWHFLTGQQDSIYELAEEHYLASVSEDPNAPGGYAHSGAFILIDSQDRIRGYYDGTNPDDVDRLIEDIKKLGVQSSARETS